MELIAETRDGDEAMRLAKSERPDLVVLALNLAEGADGILVCRNLKSLPHPPRVMIFTSYNYNEDISSCLLAEADSYLHKRYSCEEVLDVARRTASGERIWRPGGRVGDDRSYIRETSDGERLTKAECKVAALMVRRLSDEEIAKELYVEMCTVKTHVGKILRKLNIKYRWELY